MLSPRQLWIVFVTLYTICTDECTRYKLDLYLCLVVKYLKEKSNMLWYEQSSHSSYKSLLSPRKLWLVYITLYTICNDECTMYKLDLYFFIVKYLKESQTCFGLNRFHIHIVLISQCQVMWYIICHLQRWMSNVKLNIYFFLT